MVEKVFRPLVKTATRRFLALNHRAGRGADTKAHFLTPVGGGRTPQTQHQTPAGGDLT